MASRVTSVHTEEVLNVSHDAESSPLNTQGAHELSQVNGNDVLAEDSLPKLQAANRGGALPRPQPRDTEKEDEMYALSPDAKKYANMAAPTRNSASGVMGNRASQAKQSRQDEDAPTIPRAAVDELVQGGATVHDYTTGNAVRQKARPSDYEMQDVQGDSSQTPHVTKPARQPESRPTARKVSGLPTPGISGNKFAVKAPMAAPQSALEALRAKRGLVVDSPTVASSSRPATFEHSKMGGTALAPKSISPPPLSRTQPKSKPTISDTANGKLKAPAKAGPVRSSQASADIATASRKRARAGQSGGPKGNALLGGKRTSKQPQSSANPKSRLKAPARVQPKRAARPDDMYDIPAASSDGEISPPTKRARKTKAQAKMAPTKAPQASKATGSKTKTAPTPKGSSAVKAPVGSIMRDSARHRMRQASDEPAPNPVMPVLKKREKKAPVNHDEEDKENDATADLVPTRGNETLEDFENHVVQYSDDDYEIDRGRDFDMASRKLKLVKATAIDSTNIAGQVKSHKSRPVDREMAQAPVPGASQEDAIVIPDRRPSESSTPSPPRRRPEQVLRASEMSKKPEGTETPAALGSSPPLRDARTPAPLSGGLVNLDTTKKSTIISFNKSGPMNQGRLSVRELGPGSVATNRSFVPPQVASTRAKLRDRRSDGRSSAGPSVRSTKTEKSAPPTNVAEHVPDALAAFLKKGQIEDIRQTISDRSLANTSRRQAGEQNARPVPDDDDFMAIDDVEGMTLVGDELEAESKGKSGEPTASQKAMPPPPVKAQVSGATFTRPVGLLASTTSPPGKIFRRPLDTEQKPAPTPIDSNSDEDLISQTGISTNRPQHPERDMLGPSHHLSVPRPTITTSSETETSLSRVKRKPESAVDDEPPPKRKQGSERTVGFDKDPAGVTAMGTKAPSLRKKIATTSDNIAVAPKQATRPSRKSNRHASYGSQSVDIHGSPIPEGMVVEAHATALEIYSQQANISSEDASYVNAVIARKPIITTKPVIVIDPAMLAPPSAQPPPISSNIKPRPAPPQEQPRAITAIVKTEKGRLLVEDRVTKQDTDPFTSSSNNPQHLIRGGFTNFTQQLKRSTTEHEHPQRSEQPVAVEGDPDITLVNPEPVMQSHATKRTISRSTISSSDDSSQEDSTQDALADLGIWRSGLLPHQMNLFDELVNVAHRVVRHLVDQETAATNIVEDYERRGIQLVEQLDMSHAAQQKKRLASLQERKNRLRKDLGECGRKLDEGYERVTAVHRRKGRKVKSDVVEKVQDLCAQYC